MGAAIDGLLLGGCGRRSTAVLGRSSTRRDPSGRPAARLLRGPCLGSRCAGNACSRNAVMHRRKQTRAGHSCSFVILRTAHAEPARRFRKHANTKRTRRAQTQRTPPGDRYRMTISCYDTSVRRATSDPTTGRPVRAIRACRSPLPHVLDPGGSARYGGHPCGARSTPSALTALPSAG